MYKECLICINMIKGDHWGLKSSFKPSLRFMYYSFHFKTKYEKMQLDVDDEPGLLQLTVLVMTMIL